MKVRDAHIRDQLDRNSRKFSRTARYRLRKPIPKFHALIFPVSPRPRSLGSLGTALRSLPPVYFRSNLLSGCLKRFKKGGSQNFLADCVQAQIQAAESFPCVNDLFFGPLGSADPHILSPALDLNVSHDHYRRRAFTEFLDVRMGQKDSVIAGVRK